MNRLTGSLKGIVYVHRQREGKGKEKTEREIEREERKEIVTFLILKLKHYQKIYLKLSQHTEYLNTIRHYQTITLGDKLQT